MGVLTSNINVQTLRDAMDLPWTYVRDGRDEVTRREKAGLGRM